MARPIIAPRPEHRPGFEREAANESAFRRMVEQTVVELNAELATLRTAIAPLVNLPTSDPMVAGEVWNDSGVLKASAGP